MSLARDLLEQASHLAAKEPKRPKQASLRRAVSSAYYALFHLLIHDAAAAAAPSSPDGLRELVERVFRHSDMKTVCKGFIAGNPPLPTKRLLELPLHGDLRKVVNAFEQLQEAREEADYNTISTWSRMEVQAVIQLAREAFEAWARVNGTPNAKVFKSALLFQKSWNR